LLFELTGLKRLFPAAVILPLRYVEPANKDMSKMSSYDNHGYKGWLLTDSLMLRIAQEDMKAAYMHGLMPVGLKDTFSTRLLPRN
jgi:hypothetical protein